MREPPFYSIYGVPADAWTTGPVHVERVNDRASLHHGVVEAHRHPHLYQLSLWTGPGTYRFNDRDHSIRACTLSIMPPDVVHGFVIDGATDATVLSVSAAFVSEVRSWLGGDMWSVLDQPDLVVLPPDASDRLSGIFGAMEEEARFAARHDRSALAAHLHLAVILIERLSGLPPAIGSETADGRLLRKFLALTNERRPDRWSTARYVEALGTTHYLLNRVTQHAFGRTPSELIRERTLGEAKRILLFSKASVAEVGHVLGFDDPAHFGRFFKRMTNELPGAWRRTEVSRLKRND